MKKLLQLLFVLVLFSGCIEEKDRMDSWKEIIPSSAVVIKSYDDGKWVKWKFENQCFLVRLYYDGIFSMKVDCNE